MARRRKVRKCCICKKSPVWRGGDVKNPGPYCKRCYHKHVWSGRPGADDEQSVADQCVDYLCGFTDIPPYGFDFEERRMLRDPIDVYSESLLGLPLGPDEREWEWICRTAPGARKSRRESHSPPDPYPDEDEWEWICTTFRGE
jgi:hypothetical protein